MQLNGVVGGQDDNSHVPLKQRSQTPTGSIPLLSGPPPPRSSPRTTLPAKVSRLPTYFPFVLLQCFPCQVSTKLILLGVDVIITARHTLTPPPPKKTAGCVFEDEFPSGFRDLITTPLNFNCIMIRSRKVEGNSSSYFCSKVPPHRLGPPCKCLGIRFVRSLECLTRGTSHFLSVWSPGGPCTTRLM